MKKKNIKIPAGPSGRPDGAACHGQAPQNQINFITKLLVAQGGDFMIRKNLQAARKAAGLTQQAMADKLGLTLRHYQKIEYAVIGGSFAVWDALEDLLGVHQRILRETSNNHPAPKENQ